MEIIHTIGRRKASVARVYLSDGKGEITINGKDFKEYFPVETMQFKLRQPFNILDLEGKIDVKANVNGGGTTGQAEAIRLAIARGLCEMNPENRVKLKPEGMLTRDARVVERKKPGQKKARKKFQWVKR
tara:strand:- start:2742 stop:3128 length:387 start_codon:yes stop_codon:yes gene_type:complete